MPQQIERLRPRELLADNLATDGDLRRRIVVPDAGLEIVPKRGRRDERTAILAEIRVRKKVRVLVPEAGVDRRRVIDAKGRRDRDALAVYSILYLRVFVAIVQRLPAVRAIVAERYAHLEGAEKLVATVEENVLVQLENLRAFPFVAKRLEKGELRLSGWVFQIATGDVFEYDPGVGQFVPIGRPSIKPLAPVSTR